MKIHRSAEQLAVLNPPALPAAPLPGPKIEKFTDLELAHLRGELLHHQLDTWQAADVTASFLASRGYGANTINLRALIASLEMSRCSLACLQSALETVAYIQ